MATGLLQKDGRPRMGTDEWKAIANPNFKGDVGHKAGMQTFNAAFNGQQEQAGGVLAMLEVILSDFANVETDTKSAENMAADDYNKYMRDTKKNVASKERMIDMNQTEKVNAASKL